MKIIACGDAHLDSIVGGYDKHDDIKRALDFVVDLARGKDLLVFLGDMFDSKKPSPRAYATMFEALELVSCPVVMLEGNHDNGAYLPFEKIKFEFGVKIIKEPIFFDMEGNKIGFINYVRDNNEEKAQEQVDNFFDEANRGAKIVFSHLGVIGAAMSSGSTMIDGEVHIPKEVVQKASYRVINGHIHKAQTKGSVEISGSIVRVDFGEKDDEKHVLILEV